MAQGAVNVGMGLLEGVQAGMFVAGRSSSQEDVGVIMLTLDEVVVHRRAEERDDGRRCQNER